VSEALVVGADGLARCPWAGATPEYLQYHDSEWGRPVGDERRIYENLCLEGFQSGLSWLTILHKRDNFRRAFAGFDPVAVAAFDEGDIERLLADPGIVRHRGKILATVNNARATLRLRDSGTTLPSLVWHHEPASRPTPSTLATVQSMTPESKALSAELRRHGFRFVGPTTVYATMQALGVVNDHLEGCHFRQVAEAERSRFTRP
jgi:DNA-3-methyladenine glycosylase I